MKRRARTTRGARLARKAARVFASERERDVSEALGQIRAERDQARFEANRAFDAAVKKATSERAEARHKAESDYEEKRATILKAFARDGLEPDQAEIVA